MPSPPSEYTVRHGPVMFESMAKTRLTFAKEAGLRGDGEVHGSAKPNGVGAADQLRDRPARAQHVVGNYRDNDYANAEKQVSCAPHGRQPPLCL
jgi:hypothetical protein